KITFVKVTTPTAENVNFNFTGTGGVPNFTLNPVTKPSQTFIVPFGTVSATEPNNPNYAESVSGANCTSSNGGTTATAVVTAANNSITCTFTDAHLVLVKIAKSIVGTPPDAGKFNLLVDGSVVKADAGNGDFGQKLIVAAGSHTFSETAGTATSLA